MIDIPRRNPVPGDGSPRRVAFYAAERSEYAARALEGVLRYVQDHVGFLLRDFWDDVTAPARLDALLAVPPPWSDWDADGVVALLPHGPAVVPWTARGRAAVVSLGSDFRDQLPTVHVGAPSVAA